MTARIITIAQQKGGAGKSTLAAHLAVAWLAAGKRVALVDIDPQATLARWYETRAARDDAAAASEDLAFEAVTGWRAARTIERLAASCDAVVVDSPPHAETDARVAIRAADLVAVPTQPSPPDVWATRPTLELAAKEKTPAVLVLNRVPARATLTETMTAELDALGVRRAGASLGNRVAFAESMALGLAAPEYKPTSRAATEARALARELLGLEI